MAIPFEESLAAGIKDPVEREMYRNHREFKDSNLDNIMKEVLHEYVMRTLTQAIEYVIFQTYKHAWYAAHKEFSKVKNKD